MLGCVTEQLLGLEFVFSTVMPRFQQSHFPLLTLNTDAFSFLLANSTHHVTAQSPFPKPFQSISRSTIYAALPLDPTPTASAAHAELINKLGTFLFQPRKLIRPRTSLHFLYRTQIASWLQHLPAWPPFSTFSFRMLPSLRPSLLGPHCLGSSRH